MACTPPKGAPLDHAFAEIRQRLIEVTDLCTCSIRLADTQLGDTYLMDYALRNLLRTIALAQNYHKLAVGVSRVCRLGGAPAGRAPGNVNFKTPGANSDV